MIYVIEDGRGNVKVGRTRTIAKRLQNLQTGDADCHVLWCLVQLTDEAEEIAIESLFHASFGEYRAKGGSEWYVNCPAIRCWVRALACGNVSLGLDQ